MALQALKEAKIPGAMCRLTPPSSPSRKANIPGPSRPAYKSRVLAALDAEADAPNSENSRPSRSSCDRSGGNPVPARGATRSYSTIAQRSLPSGSPIAEVYRPASRSSPTLMPSNKGKSKDLRDTLEGLSAPSRAKLLELAASSLPLYSYKDYNPRPAVVYTRHEGEINDLVECLDRHLGFDMEWRVQYRRDIGTWTSGRERPTAVIQLCDTKMILVIQISAIKKVPQKLKELLENEKIQKYGVNIRNDMLKLHRDYGILMRSAVELGAMARCTDPEFEKTYKRNIVSLEKMTAMYVEKRLAKPPVRTSNWEFQPLSPDQIRYAANDVHVGLMIYKQLAKVADEQGIKVQETVAPILIDLKKELESGKLTKDKGKAQPAAVAQAPAKKIAVETASASSAVVAMETETEEMVAAASEVDTEQQPTIDESGGLSTQTDEQLCLEAYKMWHAGQMSMYQLCVHFKTRKTGLIMYILRAIVADPSLPHDVNKLTDLANKTFKTKMFFEKNWSTKDTSAGQK